MSDSRPENYPTTPLPALEQYSQVPAPDFPLPHTTANPNPQEQITIKQSNLLTRMLGGLALIKKYNETIRALPAPRGYSLLDMAINHTLSQPIIEQNRGRTW